MIGWINLCRMMVRGEGWAAAEEQEEFVRDSPVLPRGTGWTRKTKYPLPGRTFWQIPQQSCVVQVFNYSTFVNFEQFHRRRVWLRGWKLLRFINSESLRPLSINFLPVQQRPHCLATSPCSSLITGWRVISKKSA